MTKPVYDIGQICELDRWETFLNGQPHDIFTRLRNEAPIYWHEEQPVSYTHLTLPTICSV